MIVQDKEENVRYFGAVQFHEEIAKKSLALYPMVAENEEIIETTNIFPQRYAYYTCNDRLVNDGDWILTNSKGECQVVTNEKFIERFKKVEDD